MPIIQMSTNIDLTRQDKRSLLLAIAHLVSEVMERPIRDVMVSHTLAEFVMDDSFEPVAFIDFRCLPGVGMDGMMACLSDGMIRILRQYVPINPDRVFLHFLEADPDYAWRFRDGVAACSPCSVTVR